MRYNNQHMDYKLSKLPNGLRVLTVPMPSLESVTVTVWVKTGSRNEEKRINGISHFLEHMVFKGSKKRPSAREISEAVDSFGGEFNAATSKDWTNFYIKSSVERAETAFDVLSDMVLEPVLDPEEIEREKGTIVQEIAMYEDTPLIKINDVFEELIFKASTLGWDVAGIPASVRAVKRKDFVAYRGVHYHPKTMLVTVSGGISEKKALDLARKYFGEVKDTKSKEFKAGTFKVKQNKPQVSLRTKKTDQGHVIVGFMGDGRGYKNRYIQSVLGSVLNGGMSSRLWIEVRERRGLAYAVKPASDRFQDVGYFGAYAGTDPSKTSEAVKIMLEQFYGIAGGKYPVGAEELKKAKEYIKGHIALSLEDTNAVNDYFGFQALFLPKILTPEEVYRKIDKVTADEVVAEAKRLFTPKHLNLAIIGPYSSDTKFREVLK